MTTRDYFVTGFPNMLYNMPLGGSKKSRQDSNSTGHTSFGFTPLLLIDLMIT
jgi:hypothetical protein